MSVIVDGSLCVACSYMAPQHTDARVWLLSDLVFPGVLVLVFQCSYLLVHIKLEPEYGA